MNVKTKALKVVRHARCSMRIRLHLTVNEAIALHNGRKESRSKEYDRAVEKLRSSLEDMGGRQNGKMFVHE